MCWPPNLFWVGHSLACFIFLAISFCFIFISRWEDPEWIRFSGKFFIVTAEFIQWIFSFVLPLLNSVIFSPLRFPLWPGSDAFACHRWSIAEASAFILWVCWWFGCFVYSLLLVSPRASSSPDWGLPSFLTLPWRAVIASMRLLCSWKMWFLQLERKAMQFFSWTLNFILFFISISATIQIF